MMAYKNVSLFKKSKFNLNTVYNCKGWLSFNSNSMGYIIYIIFGLTFENYYYSLSLCVFDFHRSIFGRDTKLDLGFKGRSKSESSSTLVFDFRDGYLLTHHNMP